MYACMHILKIVALIKTIYPDMLWNTSLQSTPGQILRSDTIRNILQKPFQQSDDMATKIISFIRIWQLHKPEIVKEEIICWCNQIEFEVSSIKNNNSGSRGVSNLENIQFFFLTGCKFFFTNLFFYW
jgi:hypothetical protein